MGKIGLSVKDAFWFLRRNPHMIVVALVVTITVGVWGAVLIVMFTTPAPVSALAVELNEHTDLAIVLKTNPDPSPEQIAAAQKEIEGWPEVRSCTFVSKEEAFARTEAAFKDNPDALKGLAANVPPASLEISLNDPRQAGTVGHRVAEDPMVNRVVDEVAVGVTAGGTREGN